MNKDFEIIRLHKEMDAMPEFELVQHIMTLDGSLSIFKGNNIELRKALVLHSDTRLVLSLWEVKNRPALEAFQQDVSRLLHNFVTAAKSLVDHTWTLHRHLYENTNRFNDYSTEVNKRFGTNPLAKFIHGLRDYCVHYEPPPLFSQLKWSREEPTLDSGIKLYRRRLLEFSDWTSPARAIVCWRSGCL